ncbi:hypothetical protein E2562_002744 [Oryza meyeriana var. granulata]|uniref:DUF7771 domain-containing protein n=1 Tax=Oryza meyeriana var. granulata TaxID=110450 RepID=A0A6G1BPQ9_9ORYZ|nr:hypothetical protein E2562_002744 [Oryza meyeriana var. granulata]
MAPNASFKVAKKVVLTAAIVAATMLGEYPETAAARFLSPRHPRAPGTPVPSPKGGKGSVDLPPVCSFGWPCSAWPIDPEANHTVFSCDLENRMGETIWFQSDGDLWPFAVGSGETTRRLYDDLGPRKVSCAWAYDGNYKSGVPAWDRNWPEASSCRVDAGEDGHQYCRLLFENRLCSTPTPWYARVLPWTCTTYSTNTTRPYVGAVQPSWLAALIHMDD